MDNIKYIVETANEKMFPSDGRMEEELLVLLGALTSTEMSFMKFDCYKKNSSINSVITDYDEMKFQNIQIPV